MGLVLGYKKYYSPDGVELPGEPSDGERVYTLDPVTGTSKEWQWDGYNEQWYEYPYDVLLNEFDRLIKESEKTELKCDCGSDSVGSPKHSSYCPKYNS